jgi:hypothetical protein
MMKKFLIFMTVLAMASAASARLQISVHTNPPGNETWDPLNPADSEICVNVSETLELGIYSTGNEPDSFWALIAPIGLGTITGGAVHIPPAPDASMVLDPPSLAEQGLAEFFPGQEGIVGTVGSFGSQPPYPDGVYFDQIIYHQEGIGDAQILLVEINPYFWTWDGVIFDSVIIHEVPEPATALLLGFGGLALLRNRKK